MKIKKKPIKTSSGPAIADRLRIDAPSSPAITGNVVSKKSATYALVFGCIALVVVGVLTYTLYRHWQFLMPA